MRRRGRATAATQLERILYILPAAARDGGVSLDELARALEVDAGTLLGDLEEATARTFHHPGGSTESFTILLDGRRVSVHAPHEFRRPVRLTAREALALGLGLRTLAAEAEAPDRAAILALAQRLETELPVPDVLTQVDAAPPARPAAAGSASPAEDSVEYDEDAAFVLALDDDGFRGVVADAIELQQLCTLWYLKPGAQAPAHRTVAPYRLIYADGVWYVAAYDSARDDLRFFRMDRILDASLEDASAPDAPPGLDALLEGGAPYMARDDMEVEVRYSPRIARWIRERTAAEPAADGSVMVRHRVADPRWLVRHVLQYGGDAVVQGAEPAGWVASAASRILDATSA